MLRRFAPLLVAVSLVACRGSAPAGPRPEGAGAGGGTAPAPSRAPQSLSFDATPLYRQMGMLARGLPLPFVGRVSYLASPTGDRTHVVVALSLSNNVLSFVREADDRFRANYTVALTVRGASGTVANAEATEEVIVATFRETSRPEESVIFQEILDVPPGEHILVVALRDEGSQRSAQEEITLRIPRLGAGTISTPVPIVEVTPRASLDSLPRLLTSPRATVIFGRDSIIPVYVERYGDLSTPSRLLIRNERGRVLWQDTIAFTAREGLASRVVEVPVARIGIGVASIAMVADGSPDTTSAGVFVGFGDDLPVATFDEMTNYLRFFAAPYRLQRLRDAAEEARPAEWATFVRETDAQPGTPAHEDLRDYFTRLVRANGRFREEATPGWLSDRGRVFIMLGEPEQLLEPTMNDFQRNRQQVWEYRSLNLQLIFFDQTGTGRWRLTPSSAVRFDAESRRRLK